MAEQFRIQKNMVHTLSLHLYSPDFYQLSWLRLVRKGRLAALNEQLYSIYYETFWI